MNKLILALVAVIGLVSSASATTYYLDDAGSDAADGLTVGTAWLTFNQAWQTIACGDVVKVLPGTYPRARILTKTRTCTAGNRILFEANDPADRPIVWSGSEITGWTQVVGKNIWWYQLTDATERRPLWLYQVKAGITKRLKHASYPNVTAEDKPYESSDMLTITTAAPANDSVVFPADLDGLDCDDCGFAALGSTDDEVLIREGNASYHCTVASYEASTNTVSFSSACQPTKGDIGEKTSYRSCRFLDADGEWCYETVGGVTRIYVRPYAGDDPSAVSIILPHYKGFANFATSTHSGDFVTFDGFVFRFYGDYAVDTNPVSETCGICDEIFTGGYLNGFSLLNIDHTYANATLFNGGAADGGLENTPLFEDILCDRIVDTKCVGFGRSHPTNSVVTFNNLTATNSASDPIFIGTGGTGTAGDVWATGEVIFDNLQIPGCGAHWAGHNDCVQTHKVRKLTVKNSTIYREDSALPLPTNVTNQMFWITASRNLTLTNNTLRDGIIGANATGYLEVTGNTLQNMRFRRSVDAVGVPEAYPISSVVAGNTVSGFFGTEIHECSATQAAAIGCDPSRDMLSPYTGLPFVSMWGCSDLSQATLTWPSGPVTSRNVEIHTNFNRALASPLGLLPETQKYEREWLMNTGYPNATYQLQGYSSMVPAPTQTDGDADTIYSCFDTCLDVANTSQLDTDTDGYGNLCDPDFDQDGLVGSPDFNYMRQCFGLPASTVVTAGPCTALDMDADGTVGASDFNRLRTFFGLPPGPSCCGKLNLQAPSGAEAPPANSEGHWWWPFDANWPGQ